MIILNTIGKEMKYYIQLLIQFLYLIFFICWIELIQEKVIFLIQNRPDLSRNAKQQSKKGKIRNRQITFCNSD